MTDEKSISQQLREAQQTADLIVDDAGACSYLILELDGLIPAIERMEQENARLRAGTGKYEWAVFADDSDLGGEGGYYEDEEESVRKVADVWARSERFTNVTIMRRPISPWEPALSGEVEEARG